VELKNVSLPEAQLEVLMKIGIAIEGRRRSENFKKRARGIRSRQLQNAACCRCSGFLELADAK